MPEGKATTCRSLILRQSDRIILSALTGLGTTKRSALLKKWGFILHKGRSTYERSGRPGRTYCKASLSINFGWTPAGWKETLKVKCPAQEHSTTSPACARIRTARSRYEHTNNKANAPHFIVSAWSLNLTKVLTIKFYFRWICFPCRGSVWFSFFSIVSCLQYP